MHQDRLDEILQHPKRLQRFGLSDANENQFYSTLGSDGMTEDFLELRFCNGVQTCFNYSDLVWFNHDPEAGCVDLAFGENFVTIKGRGLAGLFQAIKGRRVAWVKEADSELQDNSSNDCFISEIVITPPSEMVVDKSE